MGFITDLFDEIGGERLKVTDMPPLPDGCEWLCYEQTQTGNPLISGNAGQVNVEIYDPGHTCLAMITVNSLDHNDIRAAAYDMTGDEDA